MIDPASSIQGFSLDGETISIKPASSGEVLLIRCRNVLAVADKFSLSFTFPPWQWSSLLSEQSHDDIQHNCQNHRHQNGSRERKEERTILAFDADITGKSPQWQTQFRGEIHAPADEE